MQWERAGSFEVSGHLSRDGSLGWGRPCGAGGGSVRPRRARPGVVLARRVELVPRRERTAEYGEGTGERGTPVRGGKKKGGAVGGQGAEYGEGTGEPRWEDRVGRARLWRAARSATSTVASGCGQRARPRRAHPVKYIRAVPRGARARCPSASTVVFSIRAGTTGTTSRSSTNAAARSSRFRRCALVLDAEEREER